MSQVEKSNEYYPFEEKCQSLLKEPEIRFAGLINHRGTYGVYDIFAKLEAESRETLVQILTNNIRKIPKIRSTNTLSPILSQGGR